MARIARPCALATSSARSPASLANRRSPTSLPRSSCDAWSFLANRSSVFSSRTRVSSSGCCRARRARSAPPRDGSAEQPHQIIDLAGTPVTDKPFPPGRYPLLLVGSGPGALPLTYSLGRLGIEHAVLSDDPAPGGMFRRWPIFQRMLSWTKPFANHEKATRAYERFDWNSLLSDDEQLRAIMPSVMDGTSYFPSRPEMEKGLTTFAQKAGLRVRQGVRWESTRSDGKDFLLTTSDGEYVAPAVVFAVGVAEPWRPNVLALEGVQQYGDLRPAETYADRRIFIVGKQNSGFEIATGLLPWARQIVLASPSPAQLSVQTPSLAGVRARYVQPYEDWALAGGVVILDASIESVERDGDVFHVKTKSAHEDHPRHFAVDDVIAATGFTCPLRDLPEAGVATFGQSRLPAQTPFWRSVTVDGIYFAGTIMQGSQGLRKHGIPS